MLGCSLDADVTDRRGASARWRRTSAAAAALALPLAAVITAAPASAAVRYRVTHTIPVPNGPEAIAVDPAAGTAFVTKDDDTVSVINEASDRDQDHPRGSTPEGVAVDPVARAVYVANQFLGTVSVSTRPPAR